MARIADIKWNDTGNGPGVNVSVFIQGCHFHCPGCFNPSTWSFDQGRPATDEEIQKILEGIGKSGINRNLSILGGEPLAPENRKFVAKLISETRKRYPLIQIWVWTGYEKDELFAERAKDDDIEYIAQNIDAIIVGRFNILEKDLSLRYMGSRNQQIIFSKELKSDSVK